MKPTKKYLALAAVLTSTLIGAGTMLGAGLGQWDFNSGNLSQTAGATYGDLQYTDPTIQSLTQFGSTTSFGISNINGTVAQVMSFPAATNGAGYFMTSPGTANGGGSQVNEWTLLMDVYYPGSSDSLVRPIIDTDAAVNVAGPDFVISSGNGIGAPPGGPFFASIAPNTWYRVGISVTATQVNLYLNGNQVGNFTINPPGIDGRFALNVGAYSLILGTTLTNAASGYVNSIQLRDVALNAGQMQALGGPDAAGIPQTIPPVPAFIETRTPAVGSISASPTPNIHVVLNQGDTTVNAGSIQLYYDGALLSSTVSPTPPTFDVTASIAALQEPGSIHTLSLVWQGSSGTQTNSWTFSIYNYQNINLPTPFYYENFDALTENLSGPGPLPAGWSVTNQTWPGTAGFNLDDRNSDSYMDWVLVSSTRYQSWGANRTRIPPIVVNGQLLSSLADGNLMWAETDARCGNASCWGQYQELYTKDIDCTGKTNVYVAFNSIYMQNQDNMNACEYSNDGGTNWFPVRYLFCTDGNGETSDIIYTNGVIDVGQTFSRIEANRNWAPWPPGCVDTAVCPPHATNYGIYIKAPVSTNLIPYMIGYTNDAVDRDQFPYNGMEVIVVRVAKADGQSKVRFRFLDTGTSAWYWGIDNFGLYEINTPVIITQPTSQTVSAGSSASFTVVAQSATPLTYRWKHGETNLSNGGKFSGATNATLVVSNCDTNEAGQYVCVVANLYGNVRSSPATLTVVTAPQITTQPNTVVTGVGQPVSLSVTAMGRPPLTYQWLKNGSPVGPNSSTLTFASVQLSDADRYQVSITNSEGSVLSRNVRLIVSPPQIVSNLVVHLPFDGNYNDTSGRGNNATDVGGTTFLPGKIGQAMRFTTTQNGSTIQYASLGYPADLKFVDNVDFSISFWANYTLMVDDPPFISNKDWGSSGNPGWGIFTQDNGHYRANVTGTGGTKYDMGSGSTPLVRDGAWHNIILSYARGATAAGVVSSYVDGNLIDSRPDLTTGSIDTDGLGYAVNIGQDGRGTYTDGGSAGITNALIDDVGIWRRALSAQDAIAIYQAGLAGRSLSQAVFASRLTVTVSGNNLVITWSADPTLKLQRTTSISPAAWTDVPNTLGAGTATVPMTGTSSFFKLAQ